MTIGLITKLAKYTTNILNLFGSTGTAEVSYSGRTLKALLDERPSALSYSGATDQAIIIAAISALNANGGGTLDIPRKNWNFTGPIVVAVTTPIILNFLGGSVLNQAADTHMFDITLSGGGSVDFAGSVEIKCSFVGRSAGSAIIKATGSGKLRDFVISGTLRYRAGGAESQFKYGVLGVGIQDPDASGLFIYGVDGRANFHSIGMRLTCGVAQASTNLKIWGPATYNTKKGIEFSSTAYPGVEGIKIIAGDFVSCENGVTYDASTAGYVPPQLELDSCHINSYSECLVLNSVLNVKVLGGLLYRQGAGTTAPFIDITDCQDIVISTTMHVITAGLDVPGIIARGVTRPLAFMSVDDCLFWFNSPNSPCVKLEGIISVFNMGELNRRASTNPWLDLAAVTSGRPGITISPLLPRSANDPSSTTISPVAGVLDLRDSLTTNIVLSGVVSTDVITSILGRKGWKYDIRCDVGGVSYAPSTSIQIGGVTANFAYYIAGSFISFFMDGGTAARYVGGTASKSLRDPIMPVQLTTHASGALPVANSNGRCVILVTGIAGYAIMAYADAGVWRRCDDNATIIT